MSAMNALIYSVVRAMPAKLIPPPAFKQFYRSDNK